MSEELKQQIKDLIQELDNLMGVERDPTDPFPVVLVAQACNKLSELLETEG
jgi:hypothetical protein